MDNDESENEIFSDTESIPTIETINSYFDNMNQNSSLYQDNQKIDNENIQPKDDFYKPKNVSEESNSTCKVILYRISDTFFFILLVFAFVFLLISLIAFVFEVGISFYSVLMMNYVFFVSSIVSYTMAPIYQSLSSDWINFTFSFTQVILASPLISFYIFYILKSVVSLASFISDIPSVIKSICIIMATLFKELCNEYFTDFFVQTSNLIFKGEDQCIILAVFGVTIFLMAFTAGLAYVEFCFDKTIILLGSICYVINTIQIIFLILPSYLYFFQTLANRKCNEVHYVLIFTEFSNALLDGFSDESESNDEKKEKENHDKSEAEESSIAESDSIINDKLTKANIKEEQVENKHKKVLKIIDDSDISDFVDDDKEALNKFSKLINMLLQLIAANNYFCLYHYSKTIAFDEHQKRRKIVFMYIFFFLNLAVIAYDIYQLKQNYSAYFLASVIIRFILIPLLSYYNITSIIFHRSKNTSLNIVLAVSSILTIVIAIAIIICFTFTSFYQNKYRINDLAFVPPLINYTSVDREMTHHPICDYKIYDISAFDAYGYSLGGYDAKRNKTVFDNQMKIFFGENYSSHISYKIHELDDHFLFLEYHNSLVNTNIFAFRGYNSGPEVAFQLELLAIHYIIPFFEDIVPFYELINDYWLDFYTNFLNSFGLQFFENNNLMVKYVNSIVEIYRKANFEEEDQVLFSGINCGGVFAKILGTILHRKSISFISFPIDNDLFEIMFDFQPSYISLVTNVYNVDGFFSAQEPRYATNIGIDMPIFDQTKFCTSGVCEINSKTDNVYRTFCTISEICGKGNRFNYYCEKAIGKTDLETIRESLKNSE